MFESSNKNFKETIIVGAGLSGLGCAKRLYENGVDFLIISENIGGRVKTSPDGRVNYGAYYVTEDCKNILSYVSKKTAMGFGDFHYYKDERHYHFNLWSVAKHGPAFFRLWSDLRKFRERFLTMRSMAGDYSRQSLIEQDPLLRKYYHQLAGDYIKERRLENLVSEYLEAPLWASFFVDPRTVPTMIFLQCLLPMICKTYSFVLDFNKITNKFADRILKDGVIAVKKEGNMFRLLLASGGEYTCNRVIIATPMTITNKLVATPQAIKRTIECSFVHIKGEIKPRYASGDYAFFPVKEQTAISREEDGSYLYFYTGVNRIADYFVNWEVISDYSWKPALILLGDEYINLNPEPGIFLANDHDVASTEDAFINGMYTGRLVLENLKKGDLL